MTGPWPSAGGCTGEPASPWSVRAIDLLARLLDEGVVALEAGPQPVGFYVGRVGDGVGAGIKGGTFYLGTIGWRGFAAEGGGGAIGSTSPLG